ncbi:SDR family oxidoreductase [Tenacibaculum sp. 190524A05c]|uniref:SDR family oxidoreductase n=1 Tax=Tenacibaculum platacis TaxID=3137852 RepID=UPI0031FADD2E
MERLDIFSDLQDKVILITGGYGYLGKGMTNILSEYGARVYVLGRSVTKFESNFKNKSNIFFQETDISNKESIKNSFNIINEKEHKIDVLINNAYFGSHNSPEKMTEDQWRIGMDGGVNQFFDCIKASIPHLKEVDNGKIINISSMYGVVVPDLNIYEGREEFLNPPNYGTSKAAIIHLTKYYAMYLAKYGINVNAISPGPFPSEDVQKDQVFVERLKNKTKLKRIGKPEDLQGLIVLLCSSASSYITGQNITVDGGWTI